MKSLWNDNEALACGDDPIQLRVFTSQLLGRVPSLVLAGGGNTSVKVEKKNVFGDTDSLLYIKGSGRKLATIDAEGFAPLKLEAVVRLLELEQLSDTDMVRLLRSSMTDPYAPSPSVESILHAFIPFKYVDHTHADAIVTITNTQGGEDRIRHIYGERVLVIPYVMPGFLLGKKVHELTLGVNWWDLDGLILMNHGVVTFGDDPRISYELMIELVSKAEEYLERGSSVGVEVKSIPLKSESGETCVKFAALRRAVCDVMGTATIAKLDESPEACGFSSLHNVSSIVTRGLLTPEHVIYTKHIPLIISTDVTEDVARYAADYRAYFDRNTNGHQTCLDAAPRCAIWPGIGTVAFGRTVKLCDIVFTINRHTVRAIQCGEALGGWKALSEKEIFDFEYWELEQAKLGKAGPAPILQGKIGLVTGAASGIGRACVEGLRAHGAAVAALDINPRITEVFSSEDVLGLVCDVTDAAAIEAAVEAAVCHFGGLDIVVSNAGSFPASQNIVDLDDRTWNCTLDLNLSSHQRVMRACIPYLFLGIDPAVVVIGSKNVPAPGPGAAAYSAAKAGLTQLARVAALELAPKGIRVNVLHPNAVFNTAIWTPEVLENRAKHYGMSVQAYKTNNLLSVEVSSKDVAALACAMAGPLFAKTTGAQVPVDGGNVRVI